MLKALIPIKINANINSKISMMPSSNNTRISFEMPSVSKTVLIVFCYKYIRANLNSSIDNDISPSLSTVLFPILFFTKEKISCIL